MEAIFKIHADELDLELFQNIKKLVTGKKVIITIATEMDETGYLSAHPANRKHLLENMAREPSLKFTPAEFDRHVKKLLKNS